MEAEDGKPAEGEEIDAEELRIIKNLDGIEIGILTSDECPPCREIKEVLKEEIEQGKVRMIDVNSEEGQKLLKDSPKLSIPTAIIITRKACEIFHDKEDVLLKCGEEMIPIKEIGKEEKS